MSQNNYIKLFRKILEWEWYKNLNTKIVFLHLLLRANWKEGRFEGKVISRGSLVTSLANLANETGLTISEVRTALAHLEKTGEITSKGSNKFTIFTIENYDMYQASGDEKTNNNQSVHTPLTFDNQADSQLLTTIKEDNKKENGRYEKIPRSGRGKGSNNEEYPTKDCYE